MSPFLEAAAAFTLVLGALTGMGVLMRRIWNGIRKAVHVVDLVQKQLTPNGGGSMSDQVRVAADEAIKAREKAEQVATELEMFRAHQAQDSTEAAASRAKLQHDVTNLRMGQTFLLDQQAKTDQRITDHRDRNNQHVLDLHKAVDALSKESAARDRALGEALAESLDVALVVADTTDQPGEG